MSKVLQLPSPPATEPGSPPHGQKLAILDLRTAEKTTICSEIQAGLADKQPTITPDPDDPMLKYSRTIPTLVLYTDVGLAIYEEITQLKEYYPFAAELSILENYSQEIACRMFGLPSDLATLTQPEFDALATELGSGSLDKTKHLIAGFHHLLNESSSVRSIEYTALDVEPVVLKDTLEQLLNDYPTMVSHTHRAKQSTKTNRVVLSGLAATYDSGLDYFSRLKANSSRFSKNKDADCRRAFMWLGSSIGNWSNEEAVAFVQRISNVMNEGDTFLLGVDKCSDKSTIELAYHDPKGTTERFILQGLIQAGKALNQTSVLNPNNFEYVSRFNETLSRHEAYLRCKVEGLMVNLPDHGDTILLRKDEMILIEVSYKYKESQLRAMLNKAGLRFVQQWNDDGNNHTLILAEKSRLVFPLTRHLEPGVNSCGLPSLKEWEDMWSYWDLLTRDIIPTDLLMTKPIPLRHIILFYLGHIPGFAAIHLSRYFQKPLPEPEYFATIFERGIDPVVEDPNRITHSYSEVPENLDDWPSLDSILAYQHRVRERISQVYRDLEIGKIKMDRRLARVMFTIFEHEGQHAETLVYIAIQANQLRDVPGRMAPDFKSLADQWDRQVALERTARFSVMEFSPSTVWIGKDDVDVNDYAEIYDQNHRYGWDPENPRRQLSTGAFKLSATPVSNVEYLEWLKTLPKNVVDKFVPLSWQVQSLDKVFVKTLCGKVPLEYSQHWPVTASAFQLNAYAEARGGRLPTQAELSVYKATNPSDGPMENVGLANLHPVPAKLPEKTRNGYKDGSDGGVWLWTSSQLEAHPGFVPSEIYPGFSADFHDGAHLVMLGGSFATTPRLARPEFVNWYQRTYGYVLAGARVAYDV